MRYANRVFVYIEFVYFQKEFSTDRYRDRK
jgi:hypothetical protein